jgi:hypothetical protein
MVGKKKKSGKKNDSADELWVSPRSLLKGPTGERAWENRVGGIPNTSRLLELADLALGLKKPEPSKKSRRGSAHELAKTEPYSDPNKS